MAFVGHSLTRVRWLVTINHLVTHTYSHTHSHSVTHGLSVSVITKSNSQTTECFNDIEVGNIDYLRETYSLTLSLSPADLQ